MSDDFDMGADMSSDVADVDVSSDVGADSAYEDSCDMVDEFEEDVSEDASYEETSELTDEFEEDAEEFVEEPEEEQLLEFPEDAEEEDGQAVKVLKMGGSDTSTVYEDTEQKLADLQEGYQNAGEMEERIFSNILENESLSEEQRMEALQNLKADAQSLADQYYSDVADAMGAKGYEN